MKKRNMTKSTRWLLAIGSVGVSLLWATALFAKEQPPLIAQGLTTWQQTPETNGNADPPGTAVAQASPDVQASGGMQGNLDVQGNADVQGAQEMPGRQGAQGMRGTMRARLLQRFAERAQAKEKAGGGKANSSGIATTIAGLKVVVWKPASDSQHPQSPLVIFSHGFTGSEDQSRFIMEALASAGYLVIAPRHKDSLLSEHANFNKPDPPFEKPSLWNDSTFKDRHDDIVRLIAALHADSQWNPQIDWSKFALAGHSLGGYTVLCLGGGRAAWEIPGVKAILAISPYCEPLCIKGKLADAGIPVMYQGGTRDFGITPSLIRPGGAFSKATSPAYLVEFDQLGHLGWTNLNKNQAQQKIINFYCISFLDKYVKGSTSAHPETKLDGVTLLKVK
jgi:dienelactone hydrolase